MVMDKVIKITNQLSIFNNRIWEWSLWNNTGHRICFGVARNNTGSWKTKASCITAAKKFREMMDGTIMIYLVDNDKYI